MEGSNTFRFNFISMKPIFMMEQLTVLNKAIVWLDVDLEFHDFPRLFTPNSWADGPRDMAIFNFWGNETDRDTVSTGSGVVFTTTPSAASS